jgi:hypothetical protein
LCASVLVVACAGTTSAQTQQAPAFDLNAAPVAAADEGVGQFRPRPVPNALPHLGVGVKVGTLGVGFQVGTAITSRVNVRGGANFFNYNDSITEHGVVYNGTLQLQSVEAKLDLFAFGGFRVTPGVLLYNNNNVAATASATPGTGFTLGGVRYVSSPGDPLRGNAPVTLNRFSPTIGIGFGNLLPRSFRHWSLSTDLGVVFQGSPQFGLSLGGSACVAGTICQPISTLPGASQNIESERQKIQDDLKPFKYYPEVSIMFGWKL